MTTQKRTSGEVSPLAREIAQTLFGPGGRFAPKDAACAHDGCFRPAQEPTGYCCDTCNDADGDGLPPEHERGCRGRARGAPKRDAIQCRWCGRYVYESATGWLHSDSDRDICHEPHRAEPWLEGRS